MKRMTEKYSIIIHGLRAMNSNDLNSDSRYIISVH